MDGGRYLIRNPLNGFDVRITDGIHKSNSLDGAEVAWYQSIGEPINDISLALWQRLR